MNRAVTTAFLLCAAAALAAPPPPASPENDTPPASGRLLDELAALLGQEDITTLDWTRGTFLAVRLFGLGPQEVPYLQQRFQKARKSEEAMLSGLYVAVHGTSRDRTGIREELETNRQKRAWLQGLVGTEEILVASVEGGEDWKPLIQTLPNTRGCSELALLCMRSKDPLVRRFGLYAGYWFPASPYWDLTRTAGAEDSDLLTRRFANYLLKLRKK